MKTQKITTAQFNDLRESIERKSATAKLAREASNDHNKVVESIGVPKVETTLLKSPVGEILADLNVRNISASEARTDTFFSFKVL